jgi:recombinational DNA repair protein (RecF pathway)
LPVLTEAKTLETFEKLKKELNLSAYAFHIIELVDKLTAENQENRILYGMLVEILNRLSKNNPRQIFVRAFEAKILSNLGFISFQDPQVELHFHPRGGSRELLKKLEEKTWDEIERINVNQNQAMELETILRYHIERVIEGSLKARKFLKQI